MQNIKPEQVGLIRTKHATESLDNLTQDQIKKQLKYDKDTGVFTWLPGTKRSGKQAGYVSQGYRRIRMGDHLYKASRLAFLYVLGKWPVYVVDHINGISDDDRWENLRDIPQSVNNQNVQRPRKDSSLGVQGVRKIGNRFYAQVRNK